MKNNKPIKDPVVGMRIKLALPTKYCQVQSNSPYIWFKGIITKVYDNAIVVLNLKSKKCGKIDRMMCFRENGVYEKIIKQKKLKMLVSIPQPNYDIGQRFWTMYANKPREVEITGISIFKVYAKDQPRGLIRQSLLYTLETYDPYNVGYSNLGRIGEFTEERLKKECFSTKEECIKSLY